MKTPFLKSIHGKFILRTDIITLVVAAVIGGLAITTIRSLASTATASVADGTADAALQALADDVSSASSTLTMMVIVVAVLGTAAAGAVALVFARKVSTPITLLRNAVKTSTGVLPEIAQASAAGQELPALPTIALASGDELQDLADSIDYLQRTAAELAITQPVTEGKPTEKLVHLGSRSHVLLTQQMKLIEEMEKEEVNPANLQRLFQVDHLATRMRRNAESVMVLADQGSPRTLNRSVSMHQVVQAASSEIAFFDRISITDITGVSVDGSVATDLAHLLAELLDNATTFASREALTTVSGRPTDHGYLIDIVDHGKGMLPEEIATANASFAAGVAPGDVAPTSIGHEVVARLAKRHGVALKLSTSPTGGLTAQVHVPSSALPAPAQPKAQPVQAPAVVEAQPAPVVEPEHYVPEQIVEASPVAASPAPAVAAHPVDVAPAVVSADLPVTAPEPVAVAPTHDLPVTAPEPVAVAPTHDLPTPDPAPTHDLPAPDPVAVAPSHDLPTPDPVPTGVAPTEAELAQRGLTTEQQAAIDWAIEEGWGDAVADPSAPSMHANDAGADPGPLFAAAIASTELSAGPVDASALSEFEPTMAGSQEPNLDSNHDTGL